MLIFFCKWIPAFAGMTWFFVGWALPTVAVVGSEMVAVYTLHKFKSAIVLRAQHEESFFAQMIQAQILRQRRLRMTDL